MTKNTVNALAATDVEELDAIYDIFRNMDESVTVKTSYGSGWNNLVHLNELQTIYKNRYFQDIPTLSKVLSLAHFRFFYSNLSPIDDNLEETIALYEGIDLPGSDMLGHMNNLRKILDGYKLRKKLYEVNS